MPLYEYLCPEGHVSDKLIRNRAEADATDWIKCLYCEEKAERRVSSGAFFMHGSPGGYYNPSPCAKRTVNPESFSYEGTGYVNTDQTTANIN